MLLRSGRCYNLGQLSIVKYLKPQVDEIKRVIAHASIDVKKMCPRIVHKAILNSFSKGTSIPSKDNRYLSDASLIWLKDEIGICIDSEAIGCSLPLHCIKPVVQVLEECYDPNASHNRAGFPFDKEDIVVDCFKLIRRFLEVGDSVIGELIEANVVPCLTSGLDDYGEETFTEAAHSTRIILANGTKKHRKMILDAGVMSKFNSLVWRNIKISAKEGLLGLVAILSTSKTKKLAKEMVDMVTIAKLVQLLSSSDSVCVDCSLRLLDIASKDHIQQEVDAKIHEGLFRVLKTPFSDQYFGDMLNAATQNH
jgi:hypothetical protein